MLQQTNKPKRMALSQLNLPLKPNHISSSSSSLQLHSSFLPLYPSLKPISKTNRKSLSISSISSPISCSSTSKTRKIIRNPSLDRQVVKQNKIRFVQKLKTLLLSKPKHYMHLKILAKCRSYLTIPKGPKPRPLLSMIYRYPSIFETFEIPSSLTLEDTLCVRLTPKAEALALQESQLKSTISEALAIKLQKLLMMSSHHRLLLSKLVHLGPDLGLPPNFRSRLCNNHPDRFKTVNTSYGRALELVSWDPKLAIPRPQQVFKSKDLVVDRPLKFKHLRLRRGLNLKREHRDFLIKFGEMPVVSPYHEEVGEFGVSKASIEAEKRSCAVVREVLGMTVEKKTLVDHLTHFRKEFGLSNKLRGMLVRHPELFYVSIKGQRDSVFLMEGYDDRGKLVEKDELLGVKEKLLDLVREGKRMRKERRLNRDSLGDDKVGEEEEDQEEEDDDDEEDGFEDLFEDDEWEDYGEEEEEYDENGELVLDEGRGDGEFWTAETASVDDESGKKPVESW